MAAFNEITVAQLMRQIGLPDSPLVLDVCLDQDFAQDPYLIPGSLRHSHTDLAGLAARVHGRPCVVVCQKGLKLSQGVAAWLRSQGHAAEYLGGGIQAWMAQTDAPSIPFAALPTPMTGSLWVTRHRPKIDRIACPWLIRRFIDPAAQFLFVAPSEVLNVADRLGATAFDVADAPWAHVAERCTFDALLRGFGLQTVALERLARVVRAADTDNHTLAPEAAGLLAVSVGLSRQYKDDNQQLEAGLALYDALYRWARDGHAETHDSQTGGPK